MLRIFFYHFIKVLNNIIQMGYKSLLKPHLFKKN